MGVAAVSSEAFCGAAATPCPASRQQPAVLSGAAGPELTAAMPLCRVIMQEGCLSKLLKTACLQRKHVRGKVKETKPNMLPWLQADAAPEDEGAAVMATQADAVAQAGLGAHAREAGYYGGETLNLNPSRAFLAPARAWLRSTWRSAGQLGYDPLPSAGADVAQRITGPGQGSSNPDGSRQGGRQRSGTWAWLERTWRWAMALGYETLPVAATAGDGGDPGTASAALAMPMAGPRAGYTQALQAAGGAVVLDARPGEGLEAGSGSLDDRAFARWHGPGRLFAGMPDPPLDPASGPDPERIAAASLAADVAERGPPAPSSAWDCVSAWLHRMLDPIPAAPPQGQGREDPADALQEGGAPAARMDAHDFPALLHEAKARLAEAEAAVRAGRAQGASSAFYVEPHDLPGLVAAAWKGVAGAQAAVAAAEAAADQGIGRVPDPSPGTAAGALARLHDAALAVVGRELDARAAGSVAAARSGPRPVPATRGSTPIRLVVRLPAAAQAAELPEQGQGMPDLNPAGQTLSQALDSALAAARASGSQPGLEGPVGHVTLRLRGGGLPVRPPQVVQIRVRGWLGVADMGAPWLPTGPGPQADSSVSSIA